jgi:hypothetical protein
MILFSYRRSIMTKLFSKFLVVFLVILTLPGMSACAAVNVSSVPAIGDPLTYEQVREGLVTIMRQVDPNAKAYFNQMTRQWAYTWPEGEHIIVAFAKSTGLLFKGEGYAFRVNPQMLDQVVTNLTSKMGGYQQWVGPALAVAASRNPEMLITLLTMPVVAGSTDEALDPTDLRNFLPEEIVCKYFGCTYSQ